MSDIAGRVQVIVCYTKCWSCMAGECPTGWHTWADDEDTDHAIKSGRPDPATQRCGCYCQRNAQDARV